MSTTDGGGAPRVPHTGVIAVTGATGYLGGAVAGLLRARGVHPVLLVRDPSRAVALGRQSTDGPGAAEPEVRAAPYGELAQARAALDGVDVLFMVSASESLDRVDQHRTFIDAAAAAGVRHVVYTSFLGAAPDATFTLARDHYATEQHLRESGLAWTVLRDSLYLDFLPNLAGPDGVIRGPAGPASSTTAVIGAVSRADIARVADVVLANPDAHAGATYELTGREALSMAEIAAVIADVTGRPTAYQEETLAQAHASRAIYGAPDWQVEAWISTYSAVAAGELALVTDTVELLTGVPPRTLREFLELAQTR